MDLRRVEALLEKYYEGYTTLEEEQQLKMFFSRTEVPVELEHAQMQFGFFADGAKDATSSVLDEKLLALAKEHKRLSLRPVISVSRMAAGIAACFFIISGMYIMQTGTEGKKAVDARSLLAYQQAKHTLLSISEHLNKGSGKLTRLSKLNEIEQHITGKK